MKVQLMPDGQIFLMPQSKWWREYRLLFSHVEKCPVCQIHGTRYCVKAIEIVETLVAMETAVTSAKNKKEPKHDG